MASWDSALPSACSVQGSFVPKPPRLICPCLFSMGVNLARNLCSPQCFQAWMGGFSWSPPHIPLQGPECRPCAREHCEWSSQPRCESPSARLEWALEKLRLRWDQRVFIMLVSLRQVLALWLNLSFLLEPSALGLIPLSFFFFLPWPTSIGEGAVIRFRARLLHPDLLFSQSCVLTPPFKLGL